MAMDFGVLIAIIIVVGTLLLMFRSEQVRCVCMRCVARARPLHLSISHTRAHTRTLSISLSLIHRPQKPAAADAGGGARSSPGKASKRGKKAAKLRAGFEELERRKAAMIEECRAAYLAKHSSG